MPRKSLRKFVPTPDMLKGKPGMRSLQKILEDPNLFHLNRHSVSVACFVGIFTAFLPVPGQMVIAAVLAYFFRCNVAISVMLVWISNPITIPPIFFSTYRLGTWMLDSPAPDFSIDLSTQWFTEEFPKYWEPLLAGSVLSGLVFGFLGYLAMHLFWRWKVNHNWKRRKSRLQSRADNQAD